MSADWNWIGSRVNQDVSDRSWIGSRVNQDVSETGTKSGLE